jgi:ribosomal protein S25
MDVSITKQITCSLDDLIRYTYIVSHQGKNLTHEQAQTLDLHVRAWSQLSESYRQNVVDYVSTYANTLTVPKVDETPAPVQEPFVQEFREAPDYSDVVDVDSTPVETLQAPEQGTNPKNKGNTNWGKNCTNCGRLTPHRWLEDGACLKCRKILEVHKEQTRGHIAPQPSKKAEKKLKEDPPNSASSPVPEVSQVSQKIQDKIWVAMHSYCEFEVFTIKEVMERCGINLPTAQIIMRALAKNVRAHYLRVGEGEQEQWRLDD